MALTPEKRVQNKIIKYLEELEEKNYKIYHERRQAAAWTKKGLADIFIIIEGVHIELEVKEPGGEQSVSQEKWQAKCNILGINYLVVESLKEFKNYLEVYFGILE